VQVNRNVKACHAPADDLAHAHLSRFDPCPARMALPLDEMIALIRVAKRASSPLA